MLHRLLSTRAVAIGRTGVGATLLVRPRLLPELLGVDSASSARSSWALQMLGGREVALGVGALASQHSRLWTAAGLLADLTDAVVIGSSAARGRLRASTGLVSVVVASAASTVAIDALRRRPG